VSETPSCISEEALHGYVDDQLDPERRAAVERYLQSHPAVAARVAADRAQREGLRAALAPLAEAPLPPSLNLARLVETRLRPRRTAWRLAAAIALGIGLGASGGWWAANREATGSVLDALVDEAAISYATFVPDSERPVEFSASDPGALGNWVGSRLNRKLVPPDLAAAGYRLLGGRVVATGHGPAALFLYEDVRGIRLAVFARPTDAPDTATIAEVDVGARDGCAWIEDGIGYTVTGAESYPRLLELSKHVRAQSRAHG
jgi:anti-sigma factor RsiW